MDEPQTESEVAAHNVMALLSSLTTQLGNAEHMIERAQGEIEDLRTAIAYYIAQVAA